MLQRVVQTFEFPKPVSSDLRLSVGSYFQSLRSHGYAAGSGFAMSQTEDGKRITGSFIGCIPDCLARAMQEPRLADYVSGFCEEHGARERHHYERELFCENEPYAEPPPWNELWLEADWILQATPLRTAKDSIVATCLLDLSAEEHLQGDLWQWEQAYYGIYQCYLNGELYEDWARNELVNPESKLNQAGRAVASRLAAVIGCQVKYEPMTIMNDEEE